MSNPKKPSIPRQNSYTSLNDLKHNRSSSDGDNARRRENGCIPLGAAQISQNLAKVFDNKENAEPNRAKPKISDHDGENGAGGVTKQVPVSKSRLRDRPWKPSSLQLCMQMNDPDFISGSKFWEPIDSWKNNSGDIWDYSDSEAAPASSWSILTNRALLCRPLPLDIGRCTCIIVKEESPEGLRGGTLYALYTNEGQGRQNRKLAVAYHRRHNGRSEFVVAQNTKGISSSSDDGFVGTVTANLMGSKYHIWDQGRCLNSATKHSKLLAVVTFMSTIATWTGSYRSMKAWLPKHQSMQLKNTSQTQHINGLPKDWEEKLDKVHRLFSKVPHYNNASKQYELDFRDRGRAGLRIQSSVKNFQLTMEKDGKQTILQLGRVGKSKYVMDFRYPLTGYQAFCICLASINSKLCCTM